MYVLCPTLPYVYGRVDICYVNTGGGGGGGYWTNTHCSYHNAPATEQLVYVGIVDMTAALDLHYSKSNSLEQVLC